MSSKVPGDEEVCVGRTQPASRMAASLGQEGAGGLRCLLAWVSQLPQHWGLGSKAWRPLWEACGEPSLGAVSDLSMVGSELGGAPRLPVPCPSSPIAHGFSSPGPRRHGSL